MEGVLIFIGDELVSGLVANTNVLVATRELFSHGFQIKEIITLPDDLSLIKEYLRKLLRKYSFLVLSGGLGPTDDDLTNQAVAEALGFNLIENTEVAQAIAFSKEYVSSHEIARKMSLLPEGAVPLADDLTMAGYFIDLKEKLLFVLPGVPSQFEHLLTQKVIPLLSQRFRPEVLEYSQVLRFFDLNETDLNLFLKDQVFDPKELKIGYYPLLPEVKLVLRSRDKGLLTEVVSKLKKRFGPSLVSEEDVSLVEVTGRLLISQGKKLAVAESCTGGMLSSLLTSVAGSSNYFERGFVTYSPESKVELLGVKKEHIERFGVVSYQVALDMAEGLKNRVKVDYAIGITGYAGPGGGATENPVGTVYIGLAYQQKVKAFKFWFQGLERREIQLISSYTALDMLRRLIVYDEGFLRYRFAVGVEERSL
ncbi:nicotinamide-nucleotide amidohydrolase family protein [Thermodesulfobacterium sp. TA1]|uniref:nicotinamide-nucleotide amidohydrolase family protein n=1 Tax=Thermodesulfobacterium sp. TA1 TaxID=2234087 RepID=UPI001232891D|nr:nicotinamide-nucleotide amidohydrolase family protein [Thermodesulfobacterium sp. TA1]QER41828.1 nicotinamide-nucleotide amidohydrolase family protein [Thermodesulfobacterium sp. TA1]